MTDAVATRPSRRSWPGMTRPALRTVPVAVIATATMLGLVLPLLLGRSQFPVLTTILLVAAFTYAWHLVGGILGEISVAHVAFWGAGAYAVVLGRNADLVFPVSVLIGCGVALIMAAILVELMHVARLRGLSVMIFTLVFLYFVAAIVRSMESSLGGVAGQTASRVPLRIDTVYFIAVVFLGLLLFINYWMLNTRRGLVWLAIRDDPDRVPPLGWSLRSERRFAYWTSSILCAFGGGLAAASIGFVNPEVSLGLHIVLIPLLAVYVGGPGTLWGPLLGVLLLEGLAAVAVANSRSLDTAQMVRLLQFVAALVIITVALRVQERRSRALASGEETNRRSRHSRLASLTRRQDLRAPHRSGEERMPAAIRAQGLAKSFAGLTVLQDVTFEVQPGEIVGMVGPNGAGKSTVCNLIAGTLTADAGSVHLGDATLDGTPEYARARQGLGRTFQTPQSFPSLTLTENVCIAGDGVGSDAARDLLRSLGVHRPDVEAASASLLERRMVEVARLKALRPRAALLDEPFAGLSTNEHDVLLQHIVDLADSGVAVLLIEHLIPVVAPVCHRIVVLDGGRLIADGPPDAVLSDPAVVDAYLGAPVALETSAARDATSGDHCVDH